MIPGSVRNTVVIPGPWFCQECCGDSRSLVGNTVVIPGAWFSWESCGDPAGAVREVLASISQLSQPPGAAQPCSPPPGLSWCLGRALCWAGVVPRTGCPLAVFPVDGLVVSRALPAPRSPQGSQWCPQSPCPRAEPGCDSVILSDSFQLSLLLF